ncbi:MAG: xanthine dehydrogenase accessory factor [Pseudonocardiales bacterium]|nr:xanthine dehydrogenase accessory factor [Pseudonocardiales bacterium]
MRDVLDELYAWWQAGETVGVATVVGTWRSAPRPAGAALLVGPDGSVVGSVSGGCVEGATVEIATSVRGSGEPRLQHYGVSDDEAYAVGLTCGGEIELFVEPVDRSTFAELSRVVDAVRDGRPVAVATVLSGPAAGRHLVVLPDAVHGTLGSTRLDDAVHDDATGLLAQGSSAVLHYGADGERRRDDIAVFVNSVAPRPRLIIFGAIDFAAAVARIGAFLGYRVTVCDGRATFATTARFPDADEVVVEWPHRYLAATPVGTDTVVCVLTHDPKFDVPLLEVALRMPLAYVGAMGSRRTHDDRTAQLRARGLTRAELEHLHAPIGLDIGSRTPAETAISIAAEIIAQRWGGTGAPLRHIAGPIHHDKADSSG